MTKISKIENSDFKGVEFDHFKKNQIQIIYGEHVITRK